MRSEDRGSRRIRRWFRKLWVLRNRGDRARIKVGKDSCLIKTRLNSKSMILLKFIVH
jgi:hypothetical protein